MHRPKLPKLAVSKSGSLGRECRLRLCVRLTGMKVKETKKLFRLREVAHAARRPAACVTWGERRAGAGRRGEERRQLLESYFVNKEEPRPRNLCTQPQWRE